MAEDNVGRVSVRLPETETVMSERWKHNYNSDLEETVKFVLKET